MLDFYYSVSVSWCFALTSSVSLFDRTIQCLYLTLPFAFVWCKHLEYPRDEFRFEMSFSFVSSVSFSSSFSFPLTRKILEICAFSLILWVGNRDTDETSMILVMLSVVLQFWDGEQHIWKITHFRMLCFWKLNNFTHRWVSFQKSTIQGFCS